MKKILSKIDNIEEILSKEIEQKTSRSGIDNRDTRAELKARLSRAIYNLIKVTKKCEALGDEKNNG